MKLCWIVVLVGISIILVFLYSLVAMSSRSERFMWQFPVWHRLHLADSIPLTG